MSPPSRDLNIHVGLPKTGTTALQREVFTHFRGYVCGTESSGPSGELAQRMLHLFQAKGKHRDWRTDDWRLDAIDWWKQARTTSEGPLLVSLEGLFRWFDPVSGVPWPFMGDGDEGWSSRAGQHPLIDFTLALRNALSGSRIRVVLTIRNQSEFMASHYAQISYRLLEPSQRDFEKKVRQATQIADPFFNWYATSHGLVNVVGAENFKAVVFEEGLDQVSREIADFVDGSWTPPSISTPHNVRRGPTGWSVTSDGKSRLRGLSRSVWPTDSFRRIRRSLVVATRPLLRLVDGTPRSALTPIIVPEDLRAEVRSAFRASNIDLGELCGRDLSGLGY